MKHFSHFREASEKRISFILITKNRGEAMRKTLPAVRELVTREDELIIVDGASEDTTQEAVRANGDFVTLFLSEKDKNAPHAFNKGILLARGEYVVFLFDEDRMHAPALEQSINVLGAHPEIDMLVCGGTKHFRGVSRPYYYPPGTNYGKSPEDAFRYGTCANGFIMRRSMFALSGLFPTDCPGGDDIIFVAQALKRGARIKFCRINLFDFYMTEASTSARRRNEINAMLRDRMAVYCSPKFVRRNRFLHAGRERFSSPRWYARAAGYWVRMLFAQGPVTVWNRLVLRQKPGEKKRECLWDGGFS